jgi:hypothetical protein
MGIDCIEVHGWEDTISTVTNALGDLVSSAFSSQSEFGRAPTDTAPQRPQST